MKMKTMEKKLCTVCLVIALVLSMFDGVSVRAGTADAATSYCREGDSFRVEFTVVNAWDSGYEGKITIKNTGDADIENWCLGFLLAGEITSVWNAEIYSHAQNQYRLKNARWNQDIKKGGEVSFGFLVKGTSEDTPDCFCMQSEKYLVQTERYEVKYTVSDAWEKGYNVSMEIINKSEETIEDWEIEFPYTADIKSIWNGEILRQEAGTCVVKAAEYNQNIYFGSSVSFGFSCEGDIAEAPAAEMIRLMEHCTVREVQRETASPSQTGVVSSDAPQETASVVSEAPEETQEPEPTALVDDRQKVEIDGEMLPLEDLVYLEFAPGNVAESVVDDVCMVNTLPVVWEVQWESSAPAVLSEDGSVCRDDQKHQVTLTAKIRKGDQEYQLSYPVCVAPRREYQIDEMEDFSVEDLDEMNQEDEEYEYVINDYGYLTTVYGKYSTIEIDSYESALYSLCSVRTALGLTDPMTELVPYRADAVSGGFVYRFTQMVDGIECFDNIVIVGCDCDGIANFLYSSYYPVEGEVNTTPALSYRQCREKLMDEFYYNAEVAEPAEPHIFMINFYGHLDLAWEMSMELSMEWSDGSEKYEAGCYQVLVGAQDGERKYIQKQEAMSATYQGKDVFGTERTVNVTKEGNAYVFENKTSNFALFRVTYKPTTATIMSKDKIQYNALGKAGKDEISAMYHLERIQRAYALRFERKGYDGGRSQMEVWLINDMKDNSGWRSEDKETNTKEHMEVGVGAGGEVEYHIPKDRENAATPALRRITYQNGMSLAGSPDILCHEYTHAIFQEILKQNENAIAEGYFGAISEAYADLGACILMKDAEGSTWKVAESVTRGNTGVRNIADPGQTNGATRMWEKEWYLDVSKHSNIDGGGIHQNSTVISHAFYRMCQMIHEKNQEYKKNKKSTRLHKALLEWVWYDSIFLLQKDSDFYDARRAFIKSCQNYCKKVQSTHAKQYVAIIKKAFDEADVTSSTGSKFAEQRAQRQYTESYFCQDLALQGKVVQTAAGKYKNLSGVSVTICDAEGTSLGETVATGTNGRFEVHAALADAYILCLEKEGYLPEKLYLGKINEKLQEIYSCPLVEMIPETADGKGNASGMIKNAVSLKGVKGLKLSLRRGIHCDRGTVVANGTTESSGVYRWKKLDAGNYCMEISGEGFETTWLDVKVVGGKSTGGQDGYVSKGLKKKQLRVVLTWGENPEDLDAHMVCRLSNGTRKKVYFGDKTFNYQGTKICALDVDDTDSYGPETVTIYHKKNGKYTYAVHRYSSGKLGESDACVQVYLGAGNQSSATFYVPSCGSERYWTVFRFNAATNRLIPVNQTGSAIHGGKNG